MLNRRHLREQQVPTHGSNATERESTMRSSRADEIDWANDETYAAHSFANVFHSLCFTDPRVEEEYLVYVFRQRGASVLILSAFAWVALVFTVVATARQTLPSKAIHTSAYSDAYGNGVLGARFVTVLATHTAVGSGLLLLSVYLFFVGLPEKNRMVVVQSRGSGGSFEKADDDDDDDDDDEEWHSERKGRETKKISSRGGRNDIRRKERRQKGVKIPKPSRVEEHLVRNARYSEIAVIIFILSFSVSGIATLVDDEFECHRVEGRAAAILLGEASPQAEYLPSLAENATIVQRSLVLSDALYPPIRAGPLGSDENRMGLHYHFGSPFLRCQYQWRVFLGLICLFSPLIFIRHGGPRSKSTVIFTAVNVLAFVCCVFGWSGRQYFSFTDTFEALPMNLLSEMYPDGFFPNQYHEWIPKVICGIFVGLALLAYALGRGVCEKSDRRRFKALRVAIAQRDTMQKRVERLTRKVDHVIPSTIAAQEVRLLHNTRRQEEEEAGGLEEGRCNILSFNSSPHAVKFTNASGAAIEVINTAWGPESSPEYIIKVLAAVDELIMELIVNHGVGGTPKVRKQHETVAYCVSCGRLRERDKGGRELPPTPSRSVYAELYGMRRRRKWGSQNVDDDSNYPPRYGAGKSGELAGGYHKNGGREGGTLASTIPCVCGATGLRGQEPSETDKGNANLRYAAYGNGGFLVHKLGLIGDVFFLLSADHGNTFMNKYVSTHKNDKNVTAQKETKPYLDAFLPNTPALAVLMIALTITKTLLPPEDEDHVGVGCEEASDHRSPPVGAHMRRRSSTNSAFLPSPSLVTMSAGSVRLRVGLHSGVLEVGDVFAQHVCAVSASPFARIYHNAIAGGAYDGACAALAAAGPGEILATESFLASLVVLKNNEARAEQNDAPVMPPRRKDDANTNREPSIPPGVSLSGTDNGTCNGRSPHLLEAVSDNDRFEIFPSGMTIPITEQKKEEVFIISSRENAELIPFKSGHDHPHMSSPYNSESVIRQCSGASCVEMILPPHANCYPAAFNNYLQRQHAVAREGGIQKNKTSGRNNRRSQFHLSNCLEDMKGMSNNSTTTCLTQDRSEGEEGVCRLSDTVCMYINRKGVIAAPKVQLPRIQQEQRDRNHSIGTIKLSGGEKNNNMYSNKSNSDPRSDDLNEPRTLPHTLRSQYNAGTQAANNNDNEARNEAIPRRRRNRDPPMAHPAVQNTLVHRAVAGDSSAGGGAMAGIVSNGGNGAITPLGFQSPQYESAAVDGESDVFYDDAAGGAEMPSRQVLLPSPPYQHETNTTLGSGTVALIRNMTSSPSNPNNVSLVNETSNTAGGEYFFSNNMWSGPESNFASMLQLPQQQVEGVGGGAPLLLSQPHLMAPAAAALRPQGSSDADRSSQLFFSGPQQFATASHPSHVTLVGLLSSQPNPRPHPTSPLMLPNTQAVQPHQHTTAGGGERGGLVGGKSAFHPKPFSPQASHSAVGGEVITLGLLNLDSHTAQHRLSPSSGNVHTHTTNPTSPARLHTSGIMEGETFTPMTSGLQPAEEEAYTFSHKSVLHTRNNDNSRLGRGPSPLYRDLYRCCAAGLEPPLIIADPICLDTTDSSYAMRGDDHNCVVSSNSGGERSDRDRRRTCCSLVAIPTSFARRECWGPRFFGILERFVSPKVEVLCLRWYTLWSASDVAVIFFLRFLLDATLLGFGLWSVSQLIEPAGGKFRSVPFNRPLAKAGRLVNESEAPTTSSSPDFYFSGTTLGNASATETIEGSNSTTQAADINDENESTSANNSTFLMFAKASAFDILSRSSVSLTPLMAAPIIALVGAVYAFVWHRKCQQFTDGTLSTAVIGPERNLNGADTRAFTLIVTFFLIVESVCVLVGCALSTQKSWTNAFGGWAYLAMTLFISASFSYPLTMFSFSPTPRRSSSSSSTRHKLIAIFSSRFGLLLTFALVITQIFLAIYVSDRRRRGFDPTEVLFSACSYQSQSGLLEEVDSGNSNGGEVLPLSTLDMTTPICNASNFSSRSMLLFFGSLVPSSALPFPAGFLPSLEVYPEAVSNYTSSGGVEVSGMVSNNNDSVTNGANSPNGTVVEEKEEGRRESTNSSISGNSSSLYWSPMYLITTSAAGFLLGSYEDPVGIDEPSKAVAFMGLSALLTVIFAVTAVVEVQHRSLRALFVSMVQLVDQSRRLTAEENRVLNNVAGIIPRPLQQTYLRMAILMSGDQSEKHPLEKTEKKRCGYGLVDEGDVKPEPFQLFYPMTSGGLLTASRLDLSLPHVTNLKCLPTYLHHADATYGVRRSSVVIVIRTDRWQRAPHVRSPTNGVQSSIAAFSQPAGLLMTSMLLGAIEESLIEVAEFHTAATAPLSRLTHLEDGLLLLSASKRFAFPLARDVFASRANKSRAQEGGSGRQQPYLSAETLRHCDAEEELMAAHSPLAVTQVLGDSVILVGSLNPLPNLTSAQQLSSDKRTFKNDTRNNNDDGNEIHNKARSVAAEDEENNLQDENLRHEVFEAFEGDEGDAEQPRGGKEMIPGYECLAALHFLRLFQHYIDCMNRANLTTRSEEGTMGRGVIRIVSSVTAGPIASALSLSACPEAAPRRSLAPRCIVSGPSVLIGKDIVATVPRTHQDRRDRNAPQQDEPPSDDDNLLDDDAFSESEGGREEAVVESHHGKRVAPTPSPRLAQHSDQRTEALPTHVHFISRGVSTAANAAAVDMVTRGRKVKLELYAKPSIRRRLEKLQGLFDRNVRKRFIICPRSSSGDGSGPHQQRQSTETKDDLFNVSDESRVLKNNDKSRCSDHFYDSRDGARVLGLLSPAERVELAHLALSDLLSSITMSNSEVKSVRNNSLQEVHRCTFSRSLRSRSSSEKRTFEGNDDYGLMRGSCSSSHEGSSSSSRVSSSSLSSL